MGALVALLAVMFLFQTGFGRNQMVRTHRQLFGGTTYEDELKDNICNAVPTPPTPIEADEALRASVKSAVNSAVIANSDEVLNNLCDNSDFELLCPLVAGCEEGNTDGLCNLNTICDLPTQCAEYTERLAIAAQDKENRIKEAARRERCAKIPPSEICGSCGDSREGYCSVITDCNYEAYCAPTPVNAEPANTKTLLNVRIKTKGACPGVDGDFSTVRIEINKTDDADVARTELRKQINEKLFNRFGNKCSFKVHDISKVLDAAGFKASSPPSNGSGYSGDF